VVLTQQRIAVASVRDRVTLEIGNWSRSMDYEVALLLSWWMQKHAREARKFAGHLGFALRVAGTLHDASKPDAGQPFNPLGVRQVNADLLKLHQVSVRRDGQTVCVKIGADEATLPYAAALTIAQWLRMRAKESKRRAGDLERHWSVLGALHDQRVGAEVTWG
jgi:hypothetical protein